MRFLDNLMNIPDEKRMEYAVYGIAGVGVCIVLFYVPPFDVSGEMIYGLVALMLAMAVWGYMK